MAMHTIRSLTFAALLGALAQGQPQPVFRSSTDLVVVDVFVRDRSGKEIPNLSKEQFTVFEEGKPQKISVFSFEKLAGEAVPAAAAPVVAPAARKKT